MGVTDSRANVAGNDSLRFRAFVEGFDNGAACAWRTLAELVRAGIKDEDLRQVILSMHADHLGAG